MTHGGDTGRTPGGPLSRQLVLSLYLPATVLALGQSMVAPVIPNLARSFGVNVAQASLVFVAVSLGAFVATIPADQAFIPLSESKCPLVKKTQ